MDVKGLLIGVRRYKFNDKDTGEMVSGAKVSLGVLPEDNDSTGYIVQDIPAMYDSYDALAAATKSLSGELVSVGCEISLRGRYTRLRAISIQAA